MQQEKSEWLVEAAGRNGVRSSVQRAAASRVWLAGLKRRGEKDRWLSSVTEWCENYKASINSAQVNPSFPAAHFHINHQAQTQIHKHQLSSHPPVMP